MTSTVPLPGIHQPFTKDDMKESAITYNGLPRIQSNMHVNIDHVKELVEIVTRHDQLGKFGFHLAHQHGLIANDTIRLGSDLGVVAGKWSKASPIDSVDLGNIHGVVFKFLPEQQRFVPYEFDEGPSPVSVGDVDDDFIEEFIGYLTKNNLTDVFTLEVQADQPNGCTAEVEVDKLGTVTLPKTMVCAEEFLPTGWPGVLLPGDSGPPAGQSWAKKVDDSHQVFINKPITTAGELVNELAGQKVIKF